MNPETQAHLLDLRSRCIQAHQLAKEGKTAEAECIQPSLEEIREGLIALRSDRERATEKKAASAASTIPLNLNDLFTKSST